MRLELVGDHEHGAGLPVPAGQHRGPAVRLGVLGGLPERGGDGEAEFGEEVRAADGDLAALDGAAHAGAGQRGEARRRREGAQAGGGGPGDGLADRVLGGVLHRAGQPEDLVVVAWRRR